MMMHRLFLYFVLLALNLNAAAVIAAVVVPAPPKINASSYLLMDFDSGELIVSENIDNRLEPASLTKIMTAYVAGHELASGDIQLEDKVIVSEKAWRMEGSRMFIEVNKEVSVQDLLYGIIIQSGNDASVALAEHVAGSEEVFAQVMNQHAKDLGMVNTNFVNSSGMPDENHYTTARDLALLSRSFIREFPDVYAMHSILEFTYNGIRQHNRNTLLGRDEGVDGIKTGHTENAGYCLVASARRGDMRLISVVMGAEGDKARTSMTQSLLSYGFRFFETRKLYDANQVIQSGRIWKGDRDSVDLGVNRDLYITIPRGAYQQLDASVELEPTIIAPVNPGEVKGSLKVKLEGREIVNQPLIVLHPVGEGSFLNRLRDDIRLLFE